MKVLSEMLDISNKLSMCAIKNCTETSNRVKENKELTSIMVKMVLAKDFKEKQELIEKVATNQDIIDNEICIFNSCKEIYKKLLNILIKIMGDFEKNMPMKFDGHIEITKGLNSIKKLIKKKNLTEEDLKTLQKEKTILFLSIMSNK